MQVVSYLANPMFGNVLRLLFPNLCLNCHNGLLKSERHLCLQCTLNLPRTNYHLDVENAVAKTLWGRIPFEKAIAFLYFNKSGITQKLLHELKYGGNENLARHLGCIYASSIETYIAENKIDSVAAIPLHPSKLRKRGYNQSLAFAEGLAETLGIKNLSSGIQRKVATQTQTRKTRQQRWENVQNIFEIKNPIEFIGKHVLLVDDVITTGSTIESCVRTIHSSVNCSVSIASIAHAP